MAPKPSCHCGTCRKCAHRDYMRNWYRTKRRGAMVLTLCMQCKAAVFLQSERQLESAPKQFCSRSCKDAHRNKIRGRLIAAGKPERWCRHCGDPMPKALRSDAAYCSKQCNRAAHALKRGNGRLGPGRRRDIERAYIIARDQSRCHICGKKCRRDEITLDHLIPLAKGGTHAPENLRVAHLSCNFSKGARAANDQLMLIG